MKSWYYIIFIGMVVLMSAQVSFAVPAFLNGLNKVEVAESVFVEGAGYLAADMAKVELWLYANAYTTITVGKKQGHFDVEMKEGSWAIEEESGYVKCEGTGILLLKGDLIHFVIETDSKVISGSAPSALILGQGAIYTKGVGEIITPDEEVTPEISDFQVTEVNQTTAELIWHTTLPTKGKVFYQVVKRGQHIGELTPDGELIIPSQEEEGYYFEHSFVLNNLKDTTVYQLSIESEFPVNETLSASDPINIFTEMPNTHSTFKGEALGYFHIEQLEGKNGPEAWAITPSGDAVFLLGFNGVTSRLVGEESLLEIYGSEKAWALDAADIMKGMAMPIVFKQYFGDDIITDLQAPIIYTKEPNIVYGNNHAPQANEIPPEHYADVFPDVFSEEFVTSAYDNVNKTVGTHVEDPRCGFVSLINEPNVYAGTYEEYPYLNGKYLWAERLINLIAEEGKPVPAGKQVYIDTVKELYGGDVAKFNAVRIKDTLMSLGDSVDHDPIENWDDLAKRTYGTEYYSNYVVGQNPELKDEIMAFTGEIYKKFLEVSIKAIRDTGFKGIICVGAFAGPGIESKILEVIRNQTDDNIFTGVNFYTKHPNAPYERRQLDRIYSLSGGKPLALTEFTFQVRSCGYPEAVDQVDRGVKYETYIRGAANIPYCLGGFWYSFSDHVRLPDTDGETDISFGDWGPYQHVSLTTTSDQPFIDKMIETNLNIYKFTDERGETNAASKE